MTAPAALRHGEASMAPSTSWSWAAATAVYFTATCLLHLEFSLWLVRPRDLPWGRHALAELVPAAMVIGALLLAWLVASHLRRSARPRMLAGAWLLWALAALAIDRWLTFSVNEYFHYPQYALLAWLIARTLDRGRRGGIGGRVLFWTTLLGIADELAQYLWITTSYSHYVDVNDVLVNLVAGAAGVLLYYGPRAATRKPAPRHRWRLLEIAVAASLAVVAAAGLASGRLQLSPPAEVAPGGLARDAQQRWTLYLQRSPRQHGSWQSGPYRGTHYVLTPLEGLLALSMAAVLFAAATRAIRTGQ